MATDTNAERVSEAANWDDVEDAVSRSLGMSFDGCHKIYLAMDENQVHVMDDNGEKRHDPDYLLLRDWWEQTCPLRFIQAVYTDDLGNDEYVRVVPQCCEWAL